MVFGLGRSNILAMFGPRKQDNPAMSNLEWSDISNMSGSRDLYNIFSFKTLNISIIFDPSILDT